MHEKESPILSLDIWDTLIRRKTFPDNIKIWSHMRWKIIDGEDILVPNLEILHERQIAERKLAQNNLELG